MEQNETIRSILSLTPSLESTIKLITLCLRLFAIANREPNRSDLSSHHLTPDHFTKPCTIPMALILPSRQLRT